ncbi:hypothetical protein GGS23DRAFT_573571 [Durotheca rogersii]|uniref:uncharacterized protein n=1 Tax=Durotheca rogersii TaxID=419775 RepID=UPI002220332D|nr:uncharacterized protein GGS23DRAFT_573571 [Durotheca rogersii]KAI5862284.1 hypothetical protein GGS23DRAFT_573571 [Durotheca rogersii]
MPWCLDMKPLLLFGFLIFLPRAAQSQLCFSLPPPRPQPHRTCRHFAHTHTRTHIPRYLRRTPNLTRYALIGARYITSP